MRPSHPSLAARLAILAVALCMLLACDTRTPENEPGVTRLSEAATGVKKKDPKEKDKNLDKSPDDVINEALEKNIKMLEANLKAQKKAEETAAKDKDRDKKHGKDKDAQLMPKTYGNSASPVVQAPPFKDKKHAPKSVTIPTSPITSSHLAEIVGPDQKSGIAGNDTVNVQRPKNKQNAGQKDNAFDKSDLKILDSTSSAELGGDRAAGRGDDEKPGFFKRLFGSKKPDTRVVKQSPSGGQITLTNDKASKKEAGQVFSEKPDGTGVGAKNQYNPKELQEAYNPFRSTKVPDAKTFVPSSRERHGFVSDQVGNELAQKRIQNEAQAQKKQNQKKAELIPPDEKPRASHQITDFEPPKPVPKSAPAAPSAIAPDSGTITAASDVNAIENTAAAAVAAKVAPTAPVTPPPAAETNEKPAPKNPTDAAVDEINQQFGTIEDYRRGLNSTDFVARETSFNRALIERREDAIPALANEVTRNGHLAVNAAHCLAVIGKVNDTVERALMTGLNTTGNSGAPLREICAEALGRLRIRRAVPMLAGVLKNEKNYRVRSTAAAALGAIGDPAAIPTLQMKLDERGEIEIVKQSVALALARFGDPAGRDHLIASLESPVPALQVLGVTGLAQLNDPSSAGYLISALDSPNDEVWTTAISLVPRLGAKQALPLLRNQLLCGNDTMRTRAALALGLLGCDDGIVLICRAARSGALMERCLGCELLYRLGRTDQVPLLIEKLRDPHTNVRQTAATALARLDAVQGAPAIAEVARGRIQNSELPAALRGATSDMNERLVMLACLRILRGEKDDLIIRTLPNRHDASWPELDRELLKQQIEMIRMYKLVDVVPGSNPGALIQAPGGQEILYRKGETIAAGFKVSEVNLGAPAKKDTPDKIGIVPFAVLLRGDERIILYRGQEAEVQNTRAQQR